jgi:hypothetical protein
MGVALRMVRSVSVIRVGLRSILVLAVIAGACGSGESPSPGPTAPTPTPPPSTSTPTPTPPPSNSCLPGAATNLGVTLTGSSTRTLTWTGGANATDYDIQIGTDSGRSDLVRDNTTQTNYTWTGGGTGTFYARVHSHNSCGSGPPSAELVFN